MPIFLNSLLFRFFIYLFFSINCCSGKWSKIWFNCDAPDGDKQTVKDVSTLSECNNLAVKAGHQYMFYGTNKDCITLKTCDTFKIAKKGSNYKLTGTKSMSNGTDFWMMLLNMRYFFQIQHDRNNEIFILQQVTSTHSGERPEKKKSPSMVAVQ